MHLTRSRAHLGWQVSADGHLSASELVAILTRPSTGHPMSEADAQVQSPMASRDLP